MISTVTTTVITILTLTAGATLATVTAIFLIVLLGTKEVVTVDKTTLLHVLGQRLDIAFLPLLLCFTIVILVGVVQAF